MFKEFQVEVLERFPCSSIVAPVLIVDDAVQTKGKKFRTEPPEMTLFIATITGTKMLVFPC
jgi:hypothetical protein